MRRLIVAVVSALVVAAPSTALAHKGNPNYRSIVHGVTPALPGVSVSVLGYDNELQLINRSGKDVTVLGYDGEPYARVLADGTVEVRTRNSPATTSTRTASGTTPAPAFANAKERAAWQVLDKTGRFDVARPPHALDGHQARRRRSRTRSKKTKIFDYGIPISASAQPDGARSPARCSGSGPTTASRPAVRDPGAARRDHDRRRDPQAPARAPPPRPGRRRAGR